MMNLFVTYTSPFSRLARIIVAEKKLEDRVEIVEARTRTADSPYYRINPSGRVPYLVYDVGVGMEDSQLICAYLDSLDGEPWLHRTERTADLAYRRLEATARSMCDGIAVWVREMRRPENERSPTILAHEAARAQRLADFFEVTVKDPLLQGPPTMAHLILVVGLEDSQKRGPGDLTQDRPQLADWLRRVADRPSIRATAPH
jgi:glutathione S-transferase